VDAMLDRLEPVEKDVKTYRPIRALFYLPLSASVFFASLLALLYYLPQFSLFSRAHPPAIGREERT